MSSESGRELRSATWFKMAEIARWQALGLSVERIAKQMGITPAGVSKLVSHRDYQSIREKVTDKVYAPLDKSIASRKANVMLEEASPSAAEALILLIQEGAPSDRRQAATAVLDRAGYGPIQKRAVRQRIEFDPVTMGLLRLALLESDLGDDDGDDATADNEGRIEGTV